ncbi:MAG TPA: DUF1127 domain-containing protein [Gammaproteobacteria bacterium]|nr:DUF1127 domain-containing protein [Gammaproteobacteria bacterium]
MSYRSSTLTAANGPDVAERLRAVRKGPFRLIRSLLHTLSCWHQRSLQRAALAELDDRMLKDIGLTRADVAREIHKPFWQR